MASKRPPAVKEEPLSKRPKVTAPLIKPGLNRNDCNLDFTVEADGITGSGLHGEGFAYCWSGARANIGIKGGKYCFGCKVTENQEVKMEDTAKDQQNLCRVGISRGDNDVANLGESLYSFGYGGSGKFSSNGAFLDYGERFSVGDTIVCAVDLESKPRAKLSFAKNGRWLGVAKEFESGDQGLHITGAQSYERAVFPHVLLKNVEVRVLLSIDHGLVPLDGYKPWDAAVEDGNAVEGPNALGTNPNALETNSCEVIMMVGLPGSGKTTWAEKWAREHPDKRYMVIGTNLALDQMKVPGLVRKRNYGERFEKLMQRATLIFNKLLERASKTPRNCIIDQTNVYKSARWRKIKTFRNFSKIAVVVFPTVEELRNRTAARARDMGKEVPAEAVNEMLANYVIPKTKNMLNSDECFDEVWFSDLQRDEAEQCLAEMKRGLPKKGGSFRGSERSTREGSQVSGQGSYSSSYQEYNDHNARMSHDRDIWESSQTLPQGPCGYQGYPSSSDLYHHNSRMMSHDQNVREPSASLPVSAHTYPSSLAGCQSREGSLQPSPDYYGRAYQSSLAGHQLREGPLQPSPDYYGRAYQSSLAGHQSREGSLQSSSDYYGRAYQAPLGGSMGNALDPLLHSTSMADGSYAPPIYDQYGGASDPRFREAPFPYPPPSGHGRLPPYPSQQIGGWGHSYQRH